MYSSLNFKNDTKTTQCGILYSVDMYTINSTRNSRYVDSDDGSRIQKQTPPRLARPTLIADISPWDTCVDTTVVNSI